MIARLNHLRKHPSVFQHLTGLTVAVLDALAGDLVPVIDAVHRKGLERPDRQRAVGGGDNFDLSTADQVLRTVIWLRQHPTNEALGFLFGVSDSTASRARSRCVPVPAKAGRDTMRMPDPGASRRRRLPALLQDAPELAAIVDSFEQRTQRPKRSPRAYYSGKKKAHTLKSQVAVGEGSGRLVHVSDSVPGRWAGIERLDRPGLMDRLPDGVGALGDLGYTGIRDRHPSGDPSRAACGAGRIARPRTGGTTARSADGGSGSSTRSGGCADSVHWPT